MPERRAFGEVWRKRRGDGSYAWFARYRVAGRRVCSVAGATRAQAEAFLAARQVEAAHARLDGRAPTPRISLAEFRPRLESVWKARLAKTTIASRRAVLNRAVAHFGKRPMADIRRAEVEAWCAQLALAPSTVKQCLLVLSGAFTVAVAVGAARENPCRGARVKRVAEKQMPWISAAELAKLYAACTPGIRAVVVLIGETGLRRNEALLLRRREVDDAGVTVTGKGGKVRRVPLSALAKAALEEALRDRPGLPEARVFRMHPPQFNTEFRAVADAAGFPDWTPHTLRHGVASGLVRAGVDLPTVMRLMGHARIETTMRYAQWAPKDAAQRAMQALEAARHGFTRDSQSASADGSTR